MSLISINNIYLKWHQVIYNISCDTSFVWVLKSGLWIECLFVVTRFELFSEFLWSDVWCLPLQNRQSPEEQFLTERPNLKQLKHNFVALTNFNLSLIHMLLNFKYLYIVYGWLTTFAKFWFFCSISSRMSNWFMLYSDSRCSLFVICVRCVKCF